jgi:hypothetical protein
VRGRRLVSAIPASTSDAANTVKWDYLNAQGQSKIVWPPSFSLAKAYTDQLERKGSVGAGKIGDIRTRISAAEKASGAARNNALGALADVVEGSRGCDPKKIDLLKKALQDLRVPAM